VAYRGVRARLAETLNPPELDPLCQILVWTLWREGWPMNMETIRSRLALPPSTLSSALRRLEKKGYTMRFLNPTNGRYRMVKLTPLGIRIAPPVVELIDELERDVEDSAGPDARLGLDRVTWMIAAMEEHAYTARFTW
jgi:DNA-binding MarR family transcriptional regulator